MQDDLEIHHQEDDTVDAIDDDQEVRHQENDRHEDVVDTDANDDDQNTVVEDAAQDQEAGGASEDWGHHQDGPFHPKGGGGIAKSCGTCAFTFGC